MSLIIKAAVHLEIVHFNIVYLAQNSYKTQKLENFHITMNLNWSFQALKKDPRFSLYIDLYFNLFLTQSNHLASEGLENIARVGPLL